MKRTLVYFLMAAFALGVVSNTQAKKPEREFNKREVASALKKIGGDHYVEKMKINELGSIETDSEEIDDAYYWLYVAKMGKDEDGFRLIIFGNNYNYLGYYPLKNEPVSCDEDYFTVTTENEDSDYEVIDSITGERNRRSVRLNKKKEWDKRIILKAPDDSNSEFVDAPTPEELKKAKAEAAAAAATENASSSTSQPAKKKITPEYRPWKIKYGNNWLEVESAIFVDYKNRQVTLKNGKDGNTATIPLANFSDADKAYLQKLIR